MKIDLHLHTDFSDGRLSPEELLQLCKERDYKVISISDHDTVDGYLSVKDKVDEYGIILVPGLEISSNYDGIEVHILAYFFDETDKPLLRLIESINRSRLVRAQKIINKLGTNKINLDLNKIMKTTGKSRIVGRLHIARAMLELGYCTSIRDIFNRYLGDNAVAYEPKETPHVSKVIPIIKAAGGISVLAHPHRLDNISTIEGVINAGVDGMEVYCPRSSCYAVQLFEQLAKNKDLLITGGSDFHGEPEELIDFGKHTLDPIVWESIRYRYEVMKNEKIRYS
jgi:predicted metal-dependent phosphoesterase TrpH